MSNLFLDLFTAGTLANRPTQPPSGIPVALYYATDTLQLFYWTGAAWSAVSTASAPASATVLGPVKSDNGVTTSIAADGTLSIPKADNAGHLGVVKGDNATVSIAGDGTLSVAGGTRNFIAWEMGNGSWVQSAQLFATQGVGIVPLTTFTIDRIYAGLMAPTSGHTYTASVCTVNGSFVIGTITTSPGVTTGSTANQTLTFTFASPVTLTAGQAYMIAITDTSAATTTTTCAIAGLASDMQPRFATLPVDTQQNTIGINRFGLASKGPIVGDTFTNISAGGFLIGLRAQF